MSKSGARERLSEQAKMKTPDFGQMQGDLTLFNPQHRTDVLQKGRGWFKLRKKDILKSSLPQVIECVELQCEALRTLYNSIEIPERQAAEKAGVSFTSSVTLNRCQESFGRARARLAQLRAGRAPGEQELRAYTTADQSFIASAGAGTNKHHMAELGSVAN